MVGGELLQSLTCDMKGGHSRLPSGTFLPHPQRGLWLSLPLPLPVTRLTSSRDQCPRSPMVPGPVTPVYTWRTGCGPPGVWADAAGPTPPPWASVQRAQDCEWQALQTGWAREPVASGAMTVTLSSRLLGSLLRPLPCRVESAHTPLSGDRTPSFGFCLLEAQMEEAQTGRGPHGRAGEACWAPPGLAVRAGPHLCR